MKMLGTDIVTQDEFDSFIKDTYEPLSARVRLHEKYAKDFFHVKVLALISLALSAISLAILIL